MTPVAGCVPALLDAATGAEIPAVIGEEAKGLLVLKQPWPSMARTCWGDHERFENTYFSYDGYYLTGDGARRDAPRRASAGCARQTSEGARDGAKQQPSAGMTNLESEKTT